MDDKNGWNPEARRQKHIYVSRSKKREIACGFGAF